MTEQAETRQQVPETGASRGQVLVMFALMLTILIGMSAFVVDLAWIWSHQLRVQRAADAAALAGVIHLPGNVTTAVSTARAESGKNGYTNGVDGVLVNPAQDPDNARQLLVTVSEPVETFFMRLFGFNQVTVSREARAEFVLPVPMGSPQNYYGVGDFAWLAPGAFSNTGTRSPSASASPNNWDANINGAFAQGGTAATDNDGDFQGYRDFGMTVPGGNTILGIQVMVRASSTDNTGCQIGVSLSHNGSTNWTPSTERTQAINSTLTNYPLGNATDTWGRTWAPGDFTNANFRIRVHDVDPGSACTDTATTSLDHLTVIVYYQAPAAPALNPVLSPGGTPLASQGFWGAVFTKGGVRQNGDRYSPAHYSGGGSAANPHYRPQGYDYTIEVGAGGVVHLFDATFCGTGPTAFGGWYGAGDHWTSRPNPPGGSGWGPVNTRYRLYNTNGTEYLTNDDTLSADSGTIFYNENQTNQSGNYGTPQRTAAQGAANCASAAVEPYHNAWYQMASGLPAGKYRLNVQTSDSANDAIAAENLFSIHVSGGAQPRVYGGGRMAAYNNLEAGTQRFYLAQVEDRHAGKTLDITLFDPGDVSGDAFLRIYSPDGNSYDYAVFDYTADSACTTASDACSATGRTQIKTHGSGGSSFDNSVLTISIKLPTSYGSGGLTPPGETEAGWWKIEYQVTGGNDTTTWEVTIRGNPVRLVVP